MAEFKQVKAEIDKDLAELEGSLWPPVPQGPAISKGPAEPAGPSAPMGP